MSRAQTHSFRRNRLLFRLIFLFIPLFISSCTATDRAMIAKAAQSKTPKEFIESLGRQKAQQYKNNPGALVSDVIRLSELFRQLKNNAEQEWGEEEADMPGRDKYVKYTNQYQAKAIVDFKAGRVTVETMTITDTQAILKEAIITTLLTTDDPTATDIFTDKPPTFEGKPYLYRQVLDTDGKPIRYRWRAARFADYLVANKIQSHRTDKGIHKKVSFPLVTDHFELRKQKYSKYVLSAATKYQVSPTLIYAIIETESNFNPFAVSTANAYGLMQIVPSTAGKDVYIRIKNKSGEPGRTELFDPQHNIDIGTAYLHILDDIYLKKIMNTQSREYSTISAYNGGAGNVFKTFSSDRSRAPDIINRLTEQQVYDKLRHHHPRSESRRYLEKVLNFRKKY